LKSSNKDRLRIFINKEMLPTISTLYLLLYNNYFLLILKYEKSYFKFLTFHNSTKILTVEYLIKINFIQVQKCHPKINY